VKIKVASIAEFCRTGTGGTPSRSEPRYYEGDVPWIKSGELHENLICKAEEFLTEEAVRETRLKIVPSGAILIAMYGATVGRVARLGIPATTNQAVCHVIPDAKIADVHYLYYCLRSKLPEFLARRVGGAQPNISQGIIRETKIPLPPLDEQRRIAAILDKADALREKRRRAIKKLDTLLQAVFLDMFGDPVTNPKGWRTSSMESILEAIDSGWSPVCLDRPTEKDEWGVLKLGAVTSCEYREHENKALPSELQPRPELEVKDGDLLFSRKNTYDLVAACALVLSTKPKLMLSDLIFRLRLKKDAEVTPEYLWLLLTHPGKRKKVQSLAGGSAGSMPNISKSRLKDLKIEIPPMALQQKISSQVRKVYKLKATLLTSSLLADDLFESLRQRAFSGELFKGQATAAALPRKIVTTSQPELFD
jgi:type I restriction enzyme S subunit